MVEVADRVFVETGYDGVNVGAILLQDGIVCVDAPSFARDARHWSTQLDRLDSTLNRFLVLTDSHGDRLLNTRWLNASIISHQFTADRLIEYEKRYPQSMIDSLSHRNPLEGKQLATSPVDRPAVSFSAEIVINSADRKVTLSHAAGPSPGSIWICLHDAGVIFTGDCVVVDTHPPLENMCSEEWLNNLGVLSDRGSWAEIIVPGRGPVSDLTAIEPIEEYLRRLRSVVRRHIDAGQPRERLLHLVSEFVPLFPIGRLPQDWLKRQIKLGLERIYDELKPDPETLLAPVSEIWQL